MPQSENLKPYKREHLLVALVGLSPAVLTETIYALCLGSEIGIPDRILVVTTTTGRDRLIAKLFHHHGWKRLLDRLERDLGPGALANKLRFGPIEDCIRVIPNQSRDQNLRDVRTVEDNTAVADFLMDTVRGPCEDEDIQITASLAGGRKTMSALLLSIMSMLGRFSDRVVHVLVNDPWDRIPDFLFPGCPGDFHHPDTEEPLNSSTANVTLAEVPLVPLRYIFKKEIGRSASSYNRLIEQLRYKTAELDTDLEIEVNTSSGSILISGTLISASSMEFAFYGALARRAAEGLPALEQYIDLEEPVRQFTENHHSPDNFSHWSKIVLEAQIDPKENFRRYASNLRAHLREAGFNDIHINRLLPEKGRISIDAPPHSITFVS